MSPQLGSTRQSRGAVGAGNAQIHVPSLHVFGHIFPQFLTVVAQRADIEGPPRPVLVCPDLGIDPLLQL